MCHEGWDRAIAFNRYQLPPSALSVRMPSNDDRRSVRGAQQEVSCGSRQHIQQPLTPQERMLSTGVMFIPLVGTTGPKRPAARGRRRHPRWTSVPEEAAAKGSRTSSRLIGRSPVTRVRLQRSAASLLWVAPPRLPPSASRLPPLDACRPVETVRPPCLFPERAGDIVRPLKRDIRVPVRTRIRTRASICVQVRREGQKYLRIRPASEIN